MRHTCAATTGYTIYRKSPENTGKHRKSTGKHRKNTGKYRKNTGKQPEYTGNRLIFLFTENHRKNSKYRKILITGNT